MEYNTDIVIISSPKLQINGPLLSLAQLKSVIIAAGFSCKSLDFNVWLYHQMIHTDMAYVWETTDNTFIDNKLFKKELESEMIKLTKKYVEEVLKPLNPKILGISSLSKFSWPSIICMCRVFRETLPNTKILLGGPSIGLSYFITSFFYKTIKNEKLIDDYITGDAEISIVEYLKGNKSFPGINNHKYENNFNRNEIPTPDYSDVDFSLYKNLRLSVSGSRGCVRSCAFCNVPTLWPKFINKTGEKVANELIELYENYFSPKRHNFIFVDSLMNGNMKEFNSMIKILAEYRLRTNAQLFYGGQYIFRENVKPNDIFFDNLFNSGCHYVTVGIETGSDRLRFEIGKPFTTESIKNHLREFRRVGIKMTALMLIGFPTETDEDFEKTLEILDLFAENKDVVNEISVETTMVVIEGTPVHTQWENFGIEKNTLHQMTEWVSKDNNYKKRLERFFLFLDKAKRLKLYDKPTVSGKAIGNARDYLEKFTDHDPKVLKIIEENFQPK